MRIILLALALCALAAASASGASQTLRMGKAVRSRALEDDPAGGDVWPVAIFWIMIEVGTPPQSYPVAIDSGSDTLDIPHAGCSTCVSKAPNRFYDPANSTTSKPYPCDGSCSCTSGGQCGFSNSYQTCDLSNPSAVCTIEGLLYTDQVSIAPASHAVTAQFGTITSQTSNFDQFKNIDGVVGLAGGPGVSNVFQSLYAQGALPKDEFGMCFVEGKVSNGTMTVGGTDPRLHTGPFQKTPNAGAPYGFYGFRFGSAGISVAGSTIQGTGDSLFILDSGTNVLLLPETQFNSFSQILASNSSLPDVQQLLDGKCLPLTQAQIDDFPDITLQMTAAGGGAPFDLVMGPRTYLLLGEKATGYCLGVRNTGPGGDAIVGDTTMENYYVVFDRTAGTINFAPVNRAACGSV